jgi:hypothetical protein
VVAVVALDVDQDLVEQEVPVVEELVVLQRLQDLLLVQVA